MRDAWRMKRRARVERKANAVVTNVVNIRVLHQAFTREKNKSGKEGHMRR